MQFLSPINDVAFKKIFGSEEHKNVTISFFDSILEYTGKNAITDVTFLNTEQKDAPLDSKDSVLDVLCIDQSGNRYIVEVQVKQVRALDKRIVYYASKTYVKQLKKGESYIKLAPVVTIAILDFVMFPEKKRYKSIHVLHDQDTCEHDLREYTFAFVELPKFNKTEYELTTNEDKWIYFIKSISEKDYVPEALDEGEFEQACHAAERMTWTEAELDAFDDAVTIAQDQRGAMELALENQQKKIAVNMIKKNIDNKTIMEVTGLSIDEIDDLKKK